MTPTTWFVVSGAASTLVHVVIEVFFLFVCFAVVRKHRPDAAMLLAISIGLSIVIPLLRAASSFLFARVSASMFMPAAAAQNLGLSLVDVVARILLILAVVKLAQGEQAT